MSGNTSFDQETKQRADINDNGIVNVLDVIVMINRILAGGFYDGVKPPPTQGDVIPT